MWKVLRDGPTLTGTQTTPRTLNVFLVLITLTPKSRRHWAGQTGWQPLVSFCFGAPRPSRELSTSANLQGLILHFLLSSVARPGLCRCDQTGWEMSGRRYALIKAVSGVPSMQTLSLPFHSWDSDHSHNAWIERVSSASNLQTSPQGGGRRSVWISKNGHYAGDLLLPPDWLPLTR